MIAPARCHSCDRHSASCARSCATTSRLERVALYPLDRAIRRALTPRLKFVAQSNQTVNDGDKAYQSRQILIQYEPLDGAGDDDDPDLYNQWNACRQLSSALTPDLESLLWYKKLDREAMQDCAQFVQIAVGKKRDRNANAWGMLLYYMLNINLLFRCTKQDVDDVFDWMIHSVTGITYEFNKHASLIDQFVLAISRVRADEGDDGVSNPLGKMDETIYWDKLRTTASVEGGRSICVRLEPCVAVINKVLKKNFKVSLLKAAITKCTWARVCEAGFYNAAKYPWPICRLELDEGGHGMGPVKVPLTEAEAGRWMKSFPCVSFDAEQFEQVVNSVRLGSKPDVDYKTIEVDSANADKGRYNFWKEVTGREGGGGWFGFRACGHATFGEFCGPHNLMNLPGYEDNALDTAVQANNEIAGFGTIEKLFSPISLLDHFDYKPYDPVAVPPGFATIPYLARDGVGDTPMRDPMSFLGSSADVPARPRDFPREFSAEHYSPRRSAALEKSAQSDSETAPPPTRGNLGSSPRKGTSNGRDASPSGAKRGKKRRIVYDEDDENHDYQVTRARTRRHSPPCKEQPALSSHFAHGPPTEHALILSSALRCPRRLAASTWSGKTRTRAKSSCAERRASLTRRSATIAKGKAFIKGAVLRAAVSTPLGPPRRALYASRPSCSARTRVPGAAR